MRCTPLATSVLAAVAVAGCGGAAKDDGKIESKADFVAAADRICVERDTRSKQLPREANTDVGRVARGLAQAYMTAISKTEAVDLPPGAAGAGAAEYVASVSALRKPVQRMKAAAEKFRASTTVAQLKAAGSDLQTNVNTVRALSDVADLNARQYGMKSCGQQQTLPST